MPRQNLTSVTVRINTKLYLKIKAITHVTDNTMRDFFEEALNMHTQKRFDENKILKEAVSQIVESQL